MTTDITKEDARMVSRAGARLLAEAFRLTRNVDPEIHTEEIKRMGTRIYHETVGMENDLNTRSRAMALFKGSARAAMGLLDKPCLRTTEFTPEDARNLVDGLGFVFQGIVVVIRDSLEVKLEVATRLLDAARAPELGDKLDTLERAHIWLRMVCEVVLGLPEVTAETGGPRVY